MTIPWNTATSGLAPQTLSVDLGTPGSTDGLTQYDSASSLNGTTSDGSAFGSITGVTVAKDGTVTAQFSNGLTQDVYKIPLATFTNPDGLGQLSGNAYVSTKNSGPANINLANSGGRGRHPVPVAGRIDRRSRHRIHQPDHHPAGLFRFRAHHHHRRPDAAGAGTAAEQLMSGKGP